MTRIHCSILLSVCGILSAAAPGAQAQDTPTSFVHGFNSSGQTWSIAAERIRTEFQVTPALPDLSWKQTFSYQAGELNANAPGSRIAVGHSNGGLVAREWNRYYSINNRIVSVGSPHQGIPIAANVLNGEAYAYAGSLFWGIGNAWNYYAYWESRNLRNRFAYYFLVGVQQAAYYARAIPTLLGTVGFAAGAEPVLRDLTPGSTFLTNVNSSSNLAREAQVMTSRVGITTQFPTPINMQFYTLIPGNPGPWIAAREIGWAASVLAYLYYQYWLDWNDPYYYELRGGAWLWAVSAIRIMDMDASYCYLLGTLQSYTRYGLIGYSVGCAPSDGIVPVSSQQYPNSNRPPRHLVGPTHTRQTRHPTVITELVSTFEGDFLVSRRTSAPSESALTAVSITGPSSVFGWDNSTWTVSPSGGVSPITYSWEIAVDGVRVAASSGTSISYTNDGRSFTVSVTGRDALGNTRAAWQYVSIQQCGGTELC